MGVKYMRKKVEHSSGRYGISKTTRWKLKDKKSEKTPKLFVEIHN